MAATGKEVVYQGASGKRDLSKDTVMTLDSLFWIASMSKEITGAAAMQMVDQGKLCWRNRSARCCRISPRHRCLALTPTTNQSLARQKDRSHCAICSPTPGFAYNMWNGDMMRYLDKTGLPAISSGNLESLKVPLMTDPGTRWEYGTNTDFAGRAVEAVSGKRLDVYLRDHLFTPLGMTDTGYKIGDAQRQRLVSVHARGEDGSLTPISLRSSKIRSFMRGGLYGTECLETFAASSAVFTPALMPPGRLND
jgi:methyl acetate hydrolase